MILRGIIPALAGNTSLHLITDKVPEDHPRSRGEYFLYILDNSVFWGSSPLSRGIRSWPVGVCGRSGIIPALAGNTLSSWPPRSCSWDHPRSRGEY